MKNIILQGLPGVGKTTLIKKIVEKLRKMELEVNGFYTEELRDNQNFRAGFDVITLDNKRAALARKSPANDNKFKVGAYKVHIEEFESIVMPIFDNVKAIMIIDEIGKMEMFSKKFQAAVNNVILNNTIRVIATVPLKSNAPLIARIKEDQNSKLVTVKPVNRNELLDEIINSITES